MRRRSGCLGCLSCLLGNLSLFERLLDLLVLLQGSLKELGAVPGGSDDLLELLRTLFLALLDASGHQHGTGTILPG